MDHDTAQSLLGQIDDGNWLVRATAASKLRQFPDVTLPAISRFFDLTFDENMPVRYSCVAVIASMRVSAIPFLLEETAAGDPLHRQQAIWLLMEAGDWRWATTGVAEQALKPRPESTPNWGKFKDSVIAALRGTIADSDLSVRYAAASVLDEFEDHADQTIPVFIDALSHGTSRQKHWAALRLGRIGRPAQAACPELRKLVTSPSGADDNQERHGRQAAQVALKRIGCES